jgi:hypothetical protein
MMKIEEMDQLDSLMDSSLWEVAADRQNLPEIRQEALQRWLFPEDDNPDADPDDVSGGRLAELRQLATVIENDEIEEDDLEDDNEMGPYFDDQGQLLLRHNGVIYLIDSEDDEGAYDGITVKDDLYGTDEKTNPDADL